MNLSEINRATDLFPCFSCLSKLDWELAEIISITPSTVHSIHEGHVLQHAMFILSGSIRIYKISDTGREVTLYRVQGGQSCVLMMASILGETEYEASVHIETDTCVLLFPVNQFRNWMNTYKPIRQYVYKQVVLRITDVTRLLEQIAFRSIHDRLSEYLLSRFAQLESAGEAILITHEQLAIELGTAREVVSRTLKDFVKKGAISTQRGKISLLDSEQMRGPWSPL